MISNSTARPLAAVTLLVLLCTFCPADDEPAPTGTCLRLIYHEKTATKVTEFYSSRETLNSEGDSHIRAVLGAESSEADCDSSCLTSVWRYRNNLIGTIVSIARQTDTLIVEGKFKGKSLEKALQIDRAPWYQALDFALSEVVRSGKSRAEFWVVAPEDLQAHKMVAERKETEPVVVNGTKVQAVKVRLTAKGIPAFLWRTDYWFRASDCVHVRFEGRRRGPFSEKSHVELVREEACGLVDQAY